LDAICTVPENWATDTVASKATVFSAETAEPAEKILFIRSRLCLAHFIPPSQVKLGKEGMERT
ncbi:MAG: hypothetical protein Q9P14_03940, partial [candidate division KSB1 bacterium]|nr:hypothetical protein [candidate division KSB1 bacterium]